MKALTSLCVAAACIIFSGCTTTKQSTCKPVDSSAYVTLIRLSANVDGSERFIFTRRSVRHEHKFWSDPAEVTFNGEPWNDLHQSPPGWHNLGRELDLSKAWIAKRKGRDLIALEHTPEGFDLYICDSPNGSDQYDVTIAIPRRVHSSHTSQ